MTNELSMSYTSYLSSRIRISDLGAGDTKIVAATQADMAIAFSDVMLSGKFLMADSGLMVYNGRYYEPVQKGLVIKAIKVILTNLGAGSPYLVGSAKVIYEHCIDMLADKAMIPSKRFIAVRNGVIDLDDGCKLHGHSSEFHCSIYIDIDYDPKAKRDKFMKFLNEVLPNTDTQKIVQEFIGCMFIDRKKYKMERVLYMYGSGRNGKGVMSRLITELAGSENYTSFSMYDLFKSSTAPYNIATADKKLVNVCFDMGANDISGGEFKTYISGEPMMARLPHGVPFQATHPPIVIANMNRLPIVTDHTKGQDDRPIIVPFDKYIAEEDRDPLLEHKLLAELSGFFNWVIEGRNRFIENGAQFSSSEEVTKEKVKAKEDSNSLMRFLSDKYYEPTKKSYNVEVLKQFKDFNREYREHCQEYNSNAFSGNMVSRLLSSEGYIISRNRSGSTVKLYERNVFDDEPTEEDINDGLSKLPF